MTPGKATGVTYWGLGSRTVLQGAAKLFTSDSPSPNPCRSNGKKGTDEVISGCYTRG